VNLCDPQASQKNSHKKYLSKIHNLQGALDCPYTRTAGIVRRLPLSQYNTFAHHAPIRWPFEKLPDRRFHVDSL
jgi:hypothetical protein